MFVQDGLSLTRKADAILGDVFAREGDGDTTWHSLFKLGIQRGIFETSSIAYKQVIDQHKE